MLGSTDCQGDLWPFVSWMVPWIVVTLFVSIAFTTLVGSKFNRAARLTSNIGGYLTLPVGVAIGALLHSPGCQFGSYFLGYSLFAVPFFALFAGPALINWYTHKPSIRLALMLCVACAWISATFFFYVSSRPSLESVSLPKYAEDLPLNLGLVALWQVSFLAGIWLARLLHGRNRSPDERA